jgi:hypothetical protein
LCLMVVIKLGSQKELNTCKWALCLEYKKQITVVVSSGVTRALLPPWIVFTCITYRKFPPNNQGKKNCIKDGWDLTINENLH